MDKQLFKGLDSADLNQVLDHWCLDQKIEIAWNQWARVRIFCCHGTAEGVSAGLCLNQAFDEAIKSHKAMDHSASLCWNDTDSAECELIRGT